MPLEAPVTIVTFFSVVMTSPFQLIDSPASQLGRWLVPFICRAKAYRQSRCCIRPGRRCLPRSANLGEAVANLLGVQRRLLPGGEVAPPFQDVVVDQVRHPPIDPAPRGADGLARIDADAYGNLQPDRRDAHGEAFPI